MRDFFLDLFNDYLKTQFFNYLLKVVPILSVIAIIH